MILSFRHFSSAAFSLWLLLAPLAAVQARHRAAHLTEPAKVTSTMVLRGRASWYGREFQGARTASGERYNRFAYTCAHKTLPFGTRLRVTNLTNGKSVVVRVSDRGPFRHQRIIDLSEVAARPLNIVCCGAATIIAEVVPASTPLGPTKAPANLAALQAADPAPQAPFTTYGAPAAELAAEVASIIPTPLITLEVMLASVPAAPRSYVVQAGTFADVANARAVQTRLQALDPRLEVRVVDETVAGRPLSRVLIVNFAERPAAENLRRRLQLWGIGGLVRDVAQL
ncbi:septal ring lytic transglycosylase RlpA family protein [uncultured Hymenobacter sp.]|uniref:septal ring lytic transglycosylase RlpA family protein n=1 Tax=uncultured Hymenobacter sp. TaxID=170016 RepID=UPI0035CB3574